MGVPHPRRAAAWLSLLTLATFAHPAAAQEVRALGPEGGGGGAPFADRCTVAGVVVQAGWWIDGIRVLCREAVEHPLRGGSGGGTHRFELEPGERLVAISGVRLGNSGDKVYGIELHTDRRSSGMLGNAGTERGRVPFRFDVPAGWELRGITGRADGQSLLALGLEVVRVPVVSRVGPVGSGGGSAFEDACPVAALEVNAGWWIDGVRVVCADGRGTPLRGGSGGGRNVYRVPPGARITALSGTYDGRYGNRIYTLQVHTDRGSSPLFGGAGDDRGRVPFRLDVPSGHTLASVFGRSVGDALMAVGIGVVPGAPEAPRPPRAAAVPPRLLSPAPGAVMDNGCEGADAVEWRFAWEPVPGAERYHVQAERAGAANPAVNAQVTAAEFARTNRGSYIMDHFRDGWSWRVRAQVNGTWSAWSEPRPFTVEALGSDC